MLEPGDKGSERLLPLCPHNFVGLVTLINACAPTLTSIPGAKDLPERYHQEHPQQQSPYPHGDFNAWVGVDHECCSSCLGCFGVGKINENGQHQLELCSYHGLCRTSSYLQMKPQHRMSWRHPRSKHWHWLDMVIVRCTSLSMCFSPAHTTPALTKTRGNIKRSLSIHKVSWRWSVCRPPMQHCFQVMEPPAWGNSEISSCYLWEEDLKELQLVWSQVWEVDSCYCYKACFPCWKQALTNWEDPLSNQISREQSTAESKKMGQWVLAGAH